MNVTPTPTPAPGIITVLGFEFCVQGLNASCHQLALWVPGTGLLWRLRQQIHHQLSEETTAERLHRGQSTAGVSKDSLQNKTLQFKIGFSFAAAAAIGIQD